MSITKPGKEEPWKHYQKESALLPSGLLGPVTVRTGSWIDVK